MSVNIPYQTPSQIIKQYESSHSAPNIFSRFNKVVIFGKAETDLEVHHLVRNNVFYSFVIESRRPDGSADHIPVLVSQSLKEKRNIPCSIAGSFFEVAGQLRSYDFIIDGSFQRILFVFSKNISLFTRDSRIQKRLYKNAVFLHGYMDSLVSHINVSTSIILSVPGLYNNVYHIPCSFNNEYHKYPFNHGQFLTLYGRIQNRTHPHFYSFDYSNCGSPLKYEVAVSDITFTYKN